MANLERLLSREIVTLSDDSRVDPLGRVPLRLLEKLADEQDDRRRSISGLLVLGDSCTGDHSSGRVLRWYNELVSNHRGLNGRGEDQGD